MLVNRPKSDVNQLYMQKAIGSERDSKRNPKAEAEEVDNKSYMKNCQRVDEYTI